jgi:septum formation protein
MRSAREPKDTLAGVGPLILASASPRRRDILARLGYTFTIRPAEVEEALQDGESPERAAARLARLKARAVADGLGEGVVIGCDTVVAVGETVLGKPDNREEARRILSILSGKVQRVISGLCLIHPATGIEISGHETTKVFTRPMTAKDIEDYIDTGECFGKAGAYAIQETGDRFIERLEGSFDNVVGFPSELFKRLFEALAVCVEERNGD